MDNDLFTKLHAEGILSDESFEKIRQRPVSNLLSVHWEIKTILYLGVLLLTSGLGMLVYKNIDSIGHQFILLFIALVCAGCFYYCFKNKLPFSTKKVASPNMGFDYLLLLGCLSFIIFLGYLQYQYNFFGNRYGLATFIPMIVLFLCAYYFDHLAVLSMGIANLAAWMGITVTPLKILQSNDFNNGTIILTALVLAALLVAAAYFSKAKSFKRHFEFTYLNFGMHIAFISCIAAMVHYYNVYLLWYLLLLAIGWYFYTKALADRSFYLAMITTLYEYIGFSYVVVNLLLKMSFHDLTPIYLGVLYFIGSGILLVRFLMWVNKKIKTDAGI